MLGWELDRLFREKLGDPYVFSVDREEMDITNPASVMAVLKKWGPNVVINAAAYTNVDGAESERELAYAVNVTGTKNLVDACRTLGCRFVHFSTDQVFDGESKEPRTETEIPKPLNYYAQTKLEGEQYALAYPNSLVLRVQWLYGKRKDRFTPLKDKKEFSPFLDQIGCPTWTKDLAEVVVSLLINEARGLYHFAYDDYASWAEVFSYVKEKWNLSQLELKPRETAELNLPANRPRFSVLSNKKLCKTLGKESLGSWKDSLGHFLDSL
jgi:dTDP-4-dehydrorhamnose reductase